jgi:hypothetical protein
MIVDLLEHKKACADAVLLQVAEGSLMIERMSNVLLPFCYPIR